MDLFRKTSAFAVLIVMVGLGHAHGATKKIPVRAKTVATATPAPTPAIPDKNIKYYEIGKTDSPPIYTQKIEYEKLPSGELKQTVTIKDAEGTVIYNETTTSNGPNLIHQIVDHLQSKRHMEVEVKDGRVYLRTGPLASDASDKKEKPKENSEKLPKDFLTGPVSEVWLREHLDELMAGETIYAKVGILDIREVIGFKFWKKEMLKEKDREVIVIGMKPSSIFFSLLVNPIYIHMDVADKKIVRYIGRTPLWIPVKDDLKALDAEMVFD